MAINYTRMRFLDVETAFALHKTLKNELHKLTDVLNKIKNRKERGESLKSTVINRFTSDDFKDLKDILENNGMRFYDAYVIFYKDFLLGQKNLEYDWRVVIGYLFIENLNLDILNFLYKPLEDMPLCVNFQLWKGAVSKWRLRIGK